MPESGAITDQLGGLLEGVLGGFESADNHGVDHAIHFKVGERAVQRLIVHLGEPADHVVLRLRPFCCNMALDIRLKGLEFFELRLRLGLAQQIAMTLTVNEGGDLGITPFGQLRDIVFWKTEHVGHHHLRQGSCELLHKINAWVIDETIDEAMGAVLDHIGMTAGAGADPGVGEFLAMTAIEFVARPQGDHRGQHGIDPRECFARILGLFYLDNGFMNARRKSLWVLDHPGDVLVFG